MDNVTKIQLELYRKAFDDRNFRFENLTEFLVMDDFLYTAWEYACKGTKAAGVDDLTVKDIKSTGVNNFLNTIQDDLKTQNYKADAVLKHKIIKPNGKTRELGILTVKDRVVQHALKLILEPIFEVDFNNSSFGFRAHKSPQLASFEVYKWIAQGNDYIFKSDITQCLIKFHMICC